jgi:hypothetical protein
MFALTTFSGSLDAVLRRGHIDAALLVKELT